MIPKEAIEAAESALYDALTDYDYIMLPAHAMEKALTAAFAAMSEPVAWGHEDDFASGYIGDTVTVTLEDREWGEWNIPLYAAPQPAPDLAAAEERGRIEERERCARVMSDPCVQKLKDGEPFFVLLGRDAHASQALSTWITLRLRSEGRTPKVNEAEKTLDAFRDFQDAITKEPTP